MIAKAFSVWVIPNKGEAAHLKGYSTAVAAQSAGRAEAKLMFRSGATSSVEIAVIDDRTRHTLVSMSAIISREDLAALTTSAQQYIEWMRARIAVGFRFRFLRSMEAGGRQWKVYDAIEPGTKEVRERTLIEVLKK